VSKHLKRLLTEPLVQFLLIGACIYGAYGLFGNPEEEIRDTTIVVDSNRINAMIGQWESRWNRLPTREEVDKLIEVYIREDVLYRQAVAMGLNEDDPVTRRRMAKKLEFLTSDLSSMQQPKEGELEQYFIENAESYRGQDTIRFTQVFIDPDKREDETLSDATEILEQLRAAGVPDAEAIEAGDRLILQTNFTFATEQDIRRQLGSVFAEAVMKLEPGQWHGPVLSGYGVHLVYVYELLTAPAAELEEVQALVLKDWHVQKRDQFNADFLESLKGQYQIVIEELPADRLLESKKEVTGEAATDIIPLSEADSVS
jgi:peptidyl-prolyl cis-trans isomerase C